MERIEIQRLARSVNLIRPDWPVPSLETFIHRHEHMTPMDLHLQLIYVAHDPKTTTPARIDQMGPWKYLLAGPRENTGVPYRYTNPRDCATCGYPEADCRGKTDAIGHEYAPVYLKTEDRATPEQRAAVRAVLDPDANPLKRPTPELDTDMDAWENTHAATHDQETTP